MACTTTTTLKRDRGSTLLPTAYLLIDLEFAEEEEISAVNLAQVHSRMQKQCLILAVGKDD